MATEDTPNPTDLVHLDWGRHSYKFQRLRERLRAAIASGELAGKLPGERHLAKKFHVNAKTLSKALTDLAAEGLLDRSIGRGTFVKGTPGAPSHSADSNRWLVISEPDEANSALLEQLRQSYQNIQVVTDASSLRPSFLNSVKVVIDLSLNTPESVLRDLIVRNITVVLVGREPVTYSVSAVLIDRAFAGACLARDMMLGGHRRFLAVEPRGQKVVADAIRRAAQRYAPESTVDAVWPADVPGAVEQGGATAVICNTRGLAVQVNEVLARRQLAIPGRISVAAIGSGSGDHPCSGYYVQSQQTASTVVQLVREVNMKRPTTIWMTGAFHDGGTIAALHAPETSALAEQAAVSRDLAAQVGPDLRISAGAHISSR